MAAGKLSLADLEGSEYVAGPREVGATGKLSAADLEGSEVVSEGPAMRPGAVDMSPEARRARGGGSPSRPRDITAEEAGTSPGLVKQGFATLSGKAPTGPIGRLATPLLGTRSQAPAPADLGPNDIPTVTARHAGPGGLGRPAASIIVRPEQGEMADPLVQMGTAAALGMAAGGAPGVLGAPAGVARAAAPILEGGVANKALGGDFTTGAALGAIPAVVGAAGRALTSGKRAVADITRGAKKAPARLVNEVKFKAGEGGAELAEVLGEIPEVRKAVLIEARTNPAGAAKTVTEHVSILDDLTDADMAAIQRQHGGVSLKPITDRLEALEGRLNRQGRGVEADAVGRVRTDLLKRYGSELTTSTEAAAEHATQVAAAEKRMLSLRERASAARRAADDMRPQDAPKSLFEEARKIDAPQSRERSLLEAARDIDAPISRSAAADAGRAEVAGARAAERSAADAAREGLSSAEADAAKLERIASKAERDYNKLIAKNKTPVDVKIGADATRNIRNDMWTTADPARSMKPNTRRKATARIADIMNREIEDIAAQTRGIDVNALRTRNRQVSKLIPVRDALAARAEAEAERGLLAKAKAIPGNFVRRNVRRAAVAASGIPEIETLAAPVAATAPVRERRPGTLVEEPAQ